VIWKDGRKAYLVDHCINELASSKLAKRPHLMDLVVPEVGTVLLPLEMMFNHDVGCTFENVACYVTVGTFTRRGLMW
jgi:hypothetical protein